MDRVQRLWPEPAWVTPDDLREHYRVTWPDVDLGAAAMMVTSLDGSASLDGLSGGLSSPVDQMLMDVCRSVADVVVVGSATLKAEGYGALKVSQDSMAWRRQHGLSDHPVLAVVSGSLDLDPAAPFLADTSIPALILTGSTAPRHKVEALQEVAEVVVVGEGPHVDPVRAHRAFAERGHRRIQCEGGPGVLTLWYTAGRIAQLNLTVAAAVAGGDAGRILAGRHAPARRTELRQVLHDDSVLFLQHDILSD